MTIDVFSDLGIKLWKRIVGSSSVDHNICRKVYEKYLLEHEFEREITEDEWTLDEDKLFGNIDDMIAFLTEIKKEGYTEIRQIWYGYEDNGFTAVKKRLENDNELIERIKEDIDKECEAEEERIEKEKKKKDKIKQLQAEIERLKNS